MRKARQKEIHEEEAGEERGGTRAMQYAKPNQPNPKVLPKQVFQRADIDIACYDKYPWPHFILATGGVLCFHFSKDFKTGKPAQAKSINPAFVSAVFQNWEKKKHLTFFVPCMNNLRVIKQLVQTAAYETRPVTTQLSSAGSTQ